MYSVRGYSQRAYCGSLVTGLDDPAFTAFLREVTAERCWILEIDALSLAPTGARSGGYSGIGYSRIAYSRSEAGDAESTVTLRYATHGYTSQAEDTPASTYFQPRMTGDIQIARSIVGGDGIGGLSSCIASVALTNVDGGLDNLTDDYALDGRQARLYVGDKDWPLADFRLVFRGVVSTSPVINFETCRIALSDGMAKLQRPIQETLYEGSGGVEGGADLLGKPKMQAWGEILNRTADFLDGVGLVYAAQGGAMQAIDAVYDRGVELTAVGGTPSAGEYSKDLAAGTFTLGAQAAGTVTFDAHMDASGSGYIDRLGDIVLRILTGLAGLSSSEIEPGSFVRLNTAAPASIGFAVRDGSSPIRDELEALLWAQGAFGGFSRTGAFTVGMVAVPAGDPVFTLDEDSILAIEREALPAPLDPAVWRVRVGFARNWTVQNDLADSVDADRVQFAAEPIRFTEPAEDTALRSRHRLARELEIPAYYADEAAAETERDRQATLWASGLAPYRIRAPLFAMEADIGSVFEVQHPRVKHGAPTLARVLSWAISRNWVELRALL